MEDSPTLPADFADLQELANVFAISDDVRRDAATFAASPAERKMLVDALRPRFAVINAYLDEHDDEAAHTLGRLSEAACEVQIELERA